MFFIFSQNIILNPEQISNKVMDVSICNPPQVKNQGFICFNDQQNHAILLK